MAPALLAENLGKVFAAVGSANPPRWGLRNCSFAVRPGEVLGVVGRNGAGKTTLLRLLAGILRPSEGRVHHHGRVGALLDLTAGMALDFTGRENLTTLGLLTGASPAQVAANLDAAAAFAGLGDRLDDPCRTWSAGMLLRLGFAAEVTLAPSVLLVDESFAVGDAEFRTRCRERLDDLRRDGCALVVAGHDLDALAGWSTHCLWLDEGRPAALGPPADVLAAYRDHLARRGLDGHSHPRDDSSGPLGAVTLEPGGRDQMVLPVGSALSLRVELNPGPPGPLYLGVALRRRDGLLLWGSSTLREGLPPLPDPLPSHVVLELPGGELPPGEHLFDVALVTPDDEPVAYRSGAAELVVTEDRSHSQVGLFRPRHRYVVGS